MSGQNLLAIPVVARRLGISRTSVYDHIARGNLEVVDIGTGKRSRVRVPEDSVQAYLDRLLKGVRRAS